MTEPTFEEMVEGISARIDRRLKTIIEELREEIEDLKEENRALKIALHVAAAWPSKDS